MAELAVVRRYVRALFETALRSRGVDQVEDDLKAFEQIRRSVPALERVLRAPTIPTQRKRELVRHTFTDRVGPLTLRFLTLVIDRRREAILPDVYAEFQRLANAHRNIMTVEVTAATPLTDAERASLSGALARRTGKQVILQVHLDPELLGGVVLRMGDTILDGSVRTRLAQLKSRLLAGSAL